MATDIYYEPPADHAGSTDGAAVPTELLIGEDLSSMPFRDFMDKVRGEALRARAEYMTELVQEQDTAGSAEPAQSPTARSQASLS